MADPGLDQTFISEAPESKIKKSAKFRQQVESFEAEDRATAPDSKADERIHGHRVLLERKGQYGMEEMKIFAKGNDSRVIELKGRHYEGNKAGHVWHHKMEYFDMPEDGNGAETAIRNLDAKLLDHEKDIIHDWMESGSVIKITHGEIENSAGSKKATGHEWRVVTVISDGNQVGEIRTFENGLNGSEQEPSSNDIKFEHEGKTYAYPHQLTRIERGMGEPWEEAYYGLDPETGEEVPMFRRSKEKQESGPRKIVELEDLANVA